MNKKPGNVRITDIASWSSTETPHGRNNAANHPYEILRTEHLEACARDIALVFAAAAQCNTAHDLNDTLNLRGKIAYIRCQNALHLPLTPLDPHSDATLEDLTVLLQSSPKITADTPNVQTLVRDLIIQNTKETLRDDGLTRWIKSNWAQASRYADPKNARRIFCKDLKIVTQLPASGLNLHDRINEALTKIGAEPYPDLIQKQNRPNGAQNLMII